MPFLALRIIVGFVLGLAAVLIRSDYDQTVELVLLRQQLRLYARRVTQPRASRWEKVVLATLATRLPDLSRVCLVFTPATLLRWHREIVKRKWTFDNQPKRGRPPLAAACVELIVRLAREKPCWGYGKLQGGLLKLGQHVSRSAIKRHPAAAPPAARARAWCKHLA